jgi:hypothetical protein
MSSYAHHNKECTVFEASSTGITLDACKNDCAWSDTCVAVTFGTNQQGHTCVLCTSTVLQASPAGSHLTTYEKINTIEAHEVNTFDEGRCYLQAGESVGPQMKNNIDLFGLDWKKYWSANAEHDNGPLDNIQTSSAQSCCQACFDEPGCNMWTWTKNQEGCYLKHASNATRYVERYDPTRVSGGWTSDVHVERTNGREHLSTFVISSKGTDLASGEWDQGCSGTSCDVEACKQETLVRNSTYFAWANVYGGFCKILKNEYKNNPNLGTDQGYGYQLWERETKAVRAVNTHAKFNDDGVMVDYHDTDVLHQAKTSSRRRRLDGCGVDASFYAPLMQELNNLQLKDGSNNQYSADDIVNAAKLVYAALGVDELTVNGDTKSVSEWLTSPNNKRGVVRSTPYGTWMKSTAIANGKWTREEFLKWSSSAYGYNEERILVWFGAIMQKSEYFFRAALLEHLGIAISQVPAGIDQTQQSSLTNCLTAFDSWLPAAVERAAGKPCDEPIHGVDYPSQDFVKYTNDRPEAVNSTTCQVACEANTGCDFWSWSHNDPKSSCYLKSQHSMADTSHGYGYPTYSFGVTSGFMNAEHAAIGAAAPQLMPMTLARRNFEFVANVKPFEVPNRPSLYMLCSGITEAMLDDATIGVGCTFEDWKTPCFTVDEIAQAKEELAKEQALWSNSLSLAERDAHTALGCRAQ